MDPQKLRIKFVYEQQQKREIKKMRWRKAEITWDLVIKTVSKAFGLRERDQIRIIDEENSTEM